MFSKFLLNFTFFDTYCTFPCGTLLGLPFLACQDLNLIMSSEAMRDDVVVIKEFQ